MDDMNHDDHQASDPHAGHGVSDIHGSHDRHAGHSVAMFRDKFWLSLTFTIPVVFWSTDVQHWLGKVKSGRGGRIRTGDPLRPREIPLQFAENSCNAVRPSIYLLFSQLRAILAFTRSQQISLKRASNVPILCL